MAAVRGQPHQQLDRTADKQAGGQPGEYQAYFGYPRQATPEEGVDTYEKMAGALVDAITNALKR
jgi:hypothetical protein